MSAPSSSVSTRSERRLPAAAEPAASGAPPLAKDARRIVIGVMMAMFLAALDQTIVATALPRIGEQLNDFEHLPWIVTAYLLASTTVTPLYGKLSDIHGRRVVLLVGIWLFLIGSVACALAPTMLTLVLARALQGLGGGGLLSIAQTIIADVVSPKERPKYQVYFASVFVVSSLLGPVLGGYFAEHLHWSLIFWINVPLGLVALLMTSSRLKALPRHERRHKLDYLGAVLMVIATTLLMLALSWGGVRFAWSSSQILTLFAGSAVAACGFAARLLTAPEPFIPLSLFAHPVVTAGTLASCFAMGTFIGLTIYAPIYLQSVLGLSESMSGVAMIPLMVGTVAGATFSGRMMANTRHYKRLPLAALAISVVAMLVFSFFAAELPLWAVEIAFTVTSIGLGTVLPVATVSIQNAVPLHQLGTATANMNFFRSLGGAIAVAAFGAILLTGAIGGPQLLGGPSTALSSVDAAAMAARFEWLFLAAAIGLAAGLLSLAAMRELPLRAEVAHSADAIVAD